MQYDPPHPLREADAALDSQQEDNAKSDGKSHTEHSLKEFFAALLSALWRGQVRELLLQCSGGLLTSHFESLELGGLTRAASAHPPTDAVVEAKATTAKEVHALW